MNSARSKLVVGGIILSTVLSLTTPPSHASAKDVTVNEFCNVSVTIKATVPDSVEKGKNFTVSNISVQPSQTYGFTVSSSIFDMTATNTSSNVYHQDFYDTDPAPTTGHNTYKGLYPNWIINATGAVGSSVTIKLVKTVTVVQGYGTVTCKFTKTLASIPITAPPVDPPPDDPPPSGGGGDDDPTPPPSSGGGTSKPKPTTKPSTSTPDKKTNKDKKGNTPPKSSTDDKKDSATENTEKTVTVVALIVVVTNSSNKIVVDAEVTLDGSDVLKTNKQGQAIFSNVLTGSHSLLVTYKGQKVTRDIEVDSDDIGEFVSVKLPPDNSGLFLMLSIAGGATLLAAAAVATFLVIRHRRKVAAGQTTHATNINTLADGSAIEKPTQGVISHVPAIPMYESKPAAPTPAPWDPTENANPTLPAPTATPPVSELPPVEPLLSTNETAVTPAEPVVANPPQAEVVPTPVAQTAPAAAEPAPTPTTIPVQAAPSPLEAPEVQAAPDWQVMEGTPSGPSAPPTITKY